MCDYSLQFVASRPAAVGDRLVSTGFSQTISRGFASVEDANTAVCLLPGTEIAFESEVEYENYLGYASQKIAAKVARFRQIDTHLPNVHHDALEFPNGEVVLLTRLKEGQRASVLQLPPAPRSDAEVEAQKRAPVVA
ncbi:MAG: hypothetical protein M5U07_09155 [Xanthobacteraceae bacterium]|nr:hypothetical protein [Xanthobacteraceae bacterium]